MAKNRAVELSGRKWQSVGGNVIRQIWHRMLSFGRRRFVRAMLGAWVMQDQMVSR